MSDENKVVTDGVLSPVSLFTMQGAGELLTASNGKKYRIKPLTLKEVPEYMEDNVSIDNQLWTVHEEKLREKTAKWIKRKVFDEQGKPKSLEELVEEDLTIVDLRLIMKKMADLSG